MAATMFRHVRIEALAHRLPPHRIPSAALEAELAPVYQRHGIPNGLIETLVGVKARRFWDDGIEIDALAADVVKDVVDKRPELNIGMCVSGSVCKDYIEPSVAALVAGRLGFPDTCQTFDVANACLGFLTGMDLVARRIEAGEIDAGVVVAAESSRDVTRHTVQMLLDPASTSPQFRESMATLTLGSASVAALLVHERFATTNHRLNGMVSLTDPKSSRICLGTPTWMKTDGKALLENGVGLAKRTWALAEERFGWHADKMDQFLCHQVGAKHLATLSGALQIPVDRAFLTYPELGNTGPAAVPMALSLAVQGWEHSPPTVTDGARCALMGIGSGLTVTMADVQW